jgi:hypothetical protein
VQLTPGCGSATVLQSAVLVPLGVLESVLELGAEVVPASARLLLPER